MAENKKRVFIVDGYGQIYRSYFAFMTNPLKDKEGNNVSAVFGFFNTVMSLLRQYNPEYLVVAMDSRGKTFRHEMYDQYKANRDKTPEDLHAQIPVISDMLDAMGIAHYNMVGMEADDIIATIAKKASKEGLETVMVTGDKDLMQLVRDDVFALRPPRKGEKEYRLCASAEVQEIFGVRPDQIVDYLTILGDSSDNVPGINGIGEKGAVKLLADYGTLDNAYANIASLSKGVAAKLEAARDHVGLSHDLVLLKDDVFDDSQIDFERFRTKDIRWTEGVKQFRRIGSETLAKTAQRMVPASEFVLEAEANEEPEVLVQEHPVKEIETDAAGLLSRLSVLADNYLVAVDVSENTISIAFDEDNLYRLPAQGDLSGLNAQLSRMHIVGQDLKSKLKTLRSFGLDSLVPYADTMLAQWLLNTALTRFDEENSCQSLMNWRIFEPKLKEKELDGVFFNMEMPLLSVLCDMELQGIAVDVSRLDSFGKELEQQVEAVQHDIYELCGKSFNLNSPKQLQEVLFVDRNLPTGKKTKSGFSTDSDVLEELSDSTEDPVPALLLRYRMLSKLLGTYVQALPSLINPETGRIHTSFLQTGTATGRLSSKNPNLQNIPIRSDEGRRIRDAFVPKPGCVLLSADYSQIELVMLAHVSGDTNLRNAFLNGGDVHKETAALIFGVFPEMVTPAQRRAAKTINFGIMYGMSAFKLAKDLKIGRKEAQSFIDSYFEQYSGVSKLVETIKEQATRDGYVKTLMGHIRYIPEIQSSNKNIKAGAERAAVNTVIQGTAAEVMKKAMISLASELKSRKLQSRMLLQVHDEVIFEVPVAEVEQMKELVRSCMEGAYQISVPLKVGIETGNSWGEMH